MSSQVTLQQDGRILRVTLNRPSDNAVADAMALALSQALHNAHEQSDVVLITSVGPDFCTGRARNQDAGPPSPEAYERRAEYDSIFNCYKAIKNCLVPVIIAAQGRVMGFGAAICAIADVSFASDQATFNIPEIYDRIARNAILWMAYTAQFIPADEAQRLGFVSRVVKDEQLNSEVEAFLKVLLSRPRPAILGLKEYLHHAPRMDEQGAIDYARSIHSMVNTSAAMKKKSH
jgi:enoyl-CoA hydratase